MFLPIPLTLGSHQQPVYLAVGPVQRLLRAHSVTGPTRGCDRLIRKWSKK
jgi:hypothetical protein